jgi:hypothetical protein
VSPSPPASPREDSLRAFAMTLAACTAASFIGIRAALRVEPAEAIGG